MFRSFYEQVVIFSGGHERITIRMTKDKKSCTNKKYVHEIKIKHNLNLALSYNKQQ